MSTAKKYVNPLSDHWWSNPLNFRQHPSAPKATTGTNIRHAAAGSCSFPTCWNLAESCFRKGAESGVWKHNILSDYRMAPKFYVNRPMSPLAQARIDDRVPFFGRRIRWTPPSVRSQVRRGTRINSVSAWLSLCVRTSDYCWCPNIDSFHGCGFSSQACCLTVVWKTCMDGALPMCWPLL